MKIRSITYIVLVSLLLLSCSRETQETTYVAKVGNKILTESEFKDLSQNADFANRHGSEIIRRWIEDELLLQEAEEEGITENDMYKYLSEKNLRKLAGALLLEKYFNDNKILFTENDLIEFYEENKKDYVLSDEAFLFNFAEFDEESAAIQFREELLRNNGSWLKESPAIVGLTDYSTNKFSMKHDIYPVQILRSLSKLIPGEISIIITTEPGKYNIVQLIEVFEKGSIPTFSPVREIVKLRYTAYMQKQVYNEFYQELFSKYNVEINKDFK